MYEQFIDTNEVIKGVRVCLKINRVGEHKKGKLQASCVSTNCAGEMLYVLPDGKLRTKNGVLKWLNSLSDSVLEILQANSKPLGM